MGTAWIPAEQSGNISAIRSESDIAFTSTSMQVSVTLTGDFYGQGSSPTVADPHGRITFSAR